jgi:two-component system response regulator AlgR
MSREEPVTAVVVDDEPLPRLHLRRLLEQQGVSVVGEAADAGAALERTEALRPDVVLLDIQMPGVSGLQVASALALIDPPPLIVFVTGYTEHAVAAFERAALDYLVKPVSPERLLRTLTRIRSQRSLRSAHDQQRDAVMEAAEQETRTMGPLQRLPVRGDYAVRLLRVEEIISAVARERRVFVRTKDGKEYRVHYSLTQLEQMLPAEDFVRVHDSWLVSADAVEELHFLGNHAYEVRLSDGQQAPVGRTRYALLRARLGLELRLEP